MDLHLQNKGTSKVGTNLKTFPELHNKFWAQHYFGKYFGHDLQMS
jgi:hypothetical protein